MGIFGLWALFYIGDFGDFSTSCIRHNSSGPIHQASCIIKEGSSESRCSTLPPSPILKFQIENGSSDDLLNQQSYTSATKMSPWPPKMATGQDFVKKVVDEFIGAGGGREGFSLPHLQGRKVTLAFSNTLGQISETPAPGPSSSKISAS